MKNKYTLAFSIINMLFLLLFIVYTLCAKYFIILFISFSQILISYLVFITISLIVLIIKKQKNSVKAAIRILLSVVIATVLSIVCLRISSYLFRNSSITGINIDNCDSVSDFYVWEYDTFRARNVCMCTRINKYIYKKIPDTDFSVEPGFDPVDFNAFSAAYNKENGLLTIQYKIDEDCNWETVEVNVSFE